MQVSLVVQELPSSHVPLFSGVPTQSPSAHVSGFVHALPSSQEPPLVGVPTHVPFEPMSGLVHSSESLHVCAPTGIAPHMATTAATTRNFQVAVMIPPPAPNE